MRREGGDSTALFALLVATPLLLPALGVELTDLAFLLPVATLIYATVCCARASSRATARRSLWIALGLVSAITVLAALSGVVAQLMGADPVVAFYLGSLGSVGLLAGACLLAVRSLSDATFDGLSEGLICGVVVACVSVYFVVAPGVSEGDVLLTGVFVLDVAALLVAGMVSVAGPTREQRRIGRWLALGISTAVIGDALVALAAAGLAAEMPTVTAILWALAGAGLAAAAQAEGSQALSDETELSENWITNRLLLPIVAVASLPTIVLCVWLAGSLTGWTVAFFGTCLAVVITLVFGRQSYLLLDNRRAIERERRLHRDMARRNRDLQALTGLATTMTETLEEGPIVERGLDVLRIAARATSGAIHLVDPSGPDRLAAITGAWNEEHTWARRGIEDTGVGVRTRGGRHIFTLPLHARGKAFGTVTLLRGAGDAFDVEELDRLTLLAKQLATAVQNARDYRDRVEQAIRDPLTGVHNRRFFYEALDAEVSRSERYGSPFSLVIFDIDDFKSINDRLGHAAGDDVLRRITEIAAGLIRPVDSFARLGGEEFGLILPETQQLDALLVADRIRTAVARHKLASGRRVTLSAGLASCPQDAKTTDELDRRSDAALYWAKRNGKNICAVASEATLPKAGEERDATLSNLYALVSTIDAEPLHTRDHSENVAAYAVALGQELGLSEERIVSLRRAAFFHDIGKIAVSRSILAKPGELDADEWEEMKVHPTVGRSMLVHAGLHEEAAWVGQHHERIDGTGYPEGLKGDAIAEEARIIFVADAFEAMTSDRPYRKGMEVDVAVTELRACAGSQFDPRMVEALATLLERDRLPVLALRD